MRFSSIVATTRAALIVFVLSLSGSASSAEPARRSMTLVDLLNVPTLSDPRLSPNGSQLVFVLAEADWKANKQLRHIWRIGASGKGSGKGLVKLTAGSGDESSPRWSPDGKWIAFLDKRGEAEKRQAYLLSNLGGEAVRLTDHETDVSDIAWSRNGEFLYFLAADSKPTDQQQREKLKDDVFAFDENFQQHHLWKVALNDKSETRITQGGYSVLEYQLSRDGRKVAFHRAPKPLFGSIGAGEVWVMNVDGTDAVRITNNRVPEVSSRVSPDGTQVLFLSRANEKFEYYYNGNLFIAAADGGDTRLLLPELPYEVFDAAWSADGKSIYFSANMGVHTELFRVDVKTKQLTQLTKGEHSLRNWQYQHQTDRHVFSIDRRENPGDVWIRHDGQEGTPSKQITHLFEGLARELELPRQESVRWRGADGAEVEGLLYYPMGYQPSKRYPLVVQAHGGPASSDRFGFGRWINYVPILTAKGYAVLKPNYRGSTGYGNAFLRDMVGHYFKNAHLDVMAGVDHLIEKGIVDGNRMAMMGWSGGGHMTNKIITFTDRFKAASSGAGAVNWISMYSQSDVRIYRTPWFGGTLWQKNAPIDVYWEHSPLKHIAKAKTPTIILVGEKDVRVPPQQSVELYRALKSNGVATHLYIAPREPHGWRELRHRLFKMNVELGWFEKHVRNQPYRWEQGPKVDE